MAVSSVFLLPLLTAILSALFTQRNRVITLNLISSLVLLVLAIDLLMSVSEYGPISIAFGHWPLPFGIEFRVDELSALLAVFIALVSTVVTVFMGHWPSVLENPRYFAFAQLLIASALGVSFAGDLFNVYVWFELMLISVMGMLVLGGRDWHIEAAIKYFVISMLGTLMMLAAIGLIYAVSGHLNFSAIYEASRHPDSASYISLYGGMLLIALLLKIGAFPLFAWLPAAYHALPAPLLALAGGLLTKVSAYILLRISGDVLDLSMYYQALGWLAVVTMISGVLGAAYHWDLRRILAFHIVSQIGFIMLGLALMNSEAMVGTQFFLLHNIAVKTSLFLVAALLWFGTGEYDLRKMGGGLNAYPLLAGLFLLSALSLVGVPPLSGFWGKLVIIQTSLQLEHYVWAGAALLTGLLTLYSMSKIWLEAFWKPRPDSSKPRHALPWAMQASMLLLSIVIIWMGLLPESLLSALSEHTFKALEASL